MISRRPSKRALRKLNAEALAKVARLTAENARMSDQCVQYAAKLSALEWQHEIMAQDFGEALDALNELRQMAGTPEVVSAVDRAMPLPSEGDAA